MIGTMVARRLPRKMKTTIATRMNASISVCTTSSMLATTNSLVS